MTGKSIAYVALKKGGAMQVKDMPFQVSAKRALVKSEMQIKRISLTYFEPRNTAAQ